MSTVEILHNPRCSTSRKALELLHSRGIEPVIIEYLKHPPSREDLLSILKKLEASPSDLLRKKESLYRELNLAGASDETVIEAMLAHPVLIERPVVIKGRRAAIGRPVERIEEIL